MPELNAVTLLQELIKCPSVTPAEGGALQYLEDVLTPLGFKVERIVFSEPGEPDVENLYARYGDKGPHLMFAGHTDTVPYDQHSWHHDPFQLTERDGRLYGLGTSDMKSYFALALAAIRQFDARQLKQPVFILATADEESNMCGAQRVHGAEPLLAGLVADADEIDDNVRAVDGPKHGFIIADVHLHRLDLADRTERTDMARKIGAAHANPNPVALAGHLLDQLRADEPRPADNGHQTSLTLLHALRLHNLRLEFARS